MRRLFLAAMVALSGCAAKGDTGGFGGGGSNAGGGGGTVDDDEETGAAAPVIENVTATFTTYDSWVIEFLVDFDYPGDITDGLMAVGIQESGDEWQRFDLVVGTTDARLNDGLIQFAFDQVDRSQRYNYELELVAPNDGPGSDVWQGTVEAAVR
ncbi:MAG: hypothetical protein VX265_11535 [Myxococcota bacterium]|nr:hypothetical protein [Myxococcota bacterium]